MLKHKQSGFAHPLSLLFLVFVLAVIGLVGWRVFDKSTAKSTSTGFDFQACLKEHQKPGQDPHFANDACITLQNQYNDAHRTTAATSSSSTSKQSVGQQLSDNQCSGSGAGTLTHSAMNASDFKFIIPYGLLAAAHVTPIDHQYYSVNSNSAKDAYPVYAMGDAKLVDIEHRTTTVGNSSQPTSQWRLVFSHSCTWFYYYDLLTSLSPSIQRQFDQHKNSTGNDATVNINVKAGDVVGRIGGETLDFAVWDTTKPLTGFVNASDYKSEIWKVYTADPLNYESSSLKNFMLSRYPRTTAPRSGKIDLDIDGKLQGSWFQQGTNFYAGSNPSQYWAGHLAFVPDLYDPTHFWISMGNYGGRAVQYNAMGNSPQPSSVSQSTGLVKYQLVQDSYVTASGTPWDQTYYTKGPKLANSSYVVGTALVQLTGKRTLKFEAFPGATASQVHGFDSNAKTYTR